MTEYRRITDEEGTQLVRAARSIVTEYLKDNKKTVSHDEEFRLNFSFNSGVFVTITKYDDGNLRGCIGFPLPNEKLYTALEQAAIAAATEDPRFYPLSSNELDSVIFEVTVLTAPQKIVVNDPKEYASRIKVGQNGLIVRNGPNSGLLLPQVPVEYGWDEEGFLNHTCEKAGLPSDCWLDPKTEVLKFEGIVFAETSPNGTISRKQ